MPHLARRRLLGSLALPLLSALPGCAETLPPMTAPSSAADAQVLLAQAAAAHGLAALSQIDDISVSYAGEWHALVGSLQPVLVDAEYRGRSEERLLLHDPFVAQAHTGPAGRKQVVRRTAPRSEGDVRVWLNGVETQDAARRDAAALVADGYSLFLLGPMLLARIAASGRPLPVELAGAARITVGGQDHSCDVLLVRLSPGIGLSESDRLALFIDRREHLMRRVRFTLDGLDSTRGAIAEVDAWGHTTQHGVRWPRHFHERLLRPLPLPVHDWRLTGLDVNRGLDAADIRGPAFAGKALAPAAALAADTSRL